MTPKEALEELRDCCGFIDTDYRMERYNIIKQALEELKELKEENEELKIREETLSKKLEEVTVVWKNTMLAFNDTCEEFQSLQDKVANWDIIKNYIFFVNKDDEQFNRSKLDEIGIDFVLTDKTKSDFEKIKKALEGIE